MTRVLQKKDKDLFVTKGWINKFVVYKRHCSVETRGPNRKCPRLHQCLKNIKRGTHLWKIYVRYQHDKVLKRIKWYYIQRRQCLISISVMQATRYSDH